MKLATDVHYTDDTARAAGIGFADWTDRYAARSWAVHVDGVEPYVPGRFFERELPPLLTLIRRVDRDIEVVIVDGHAVLDGRPGLGQYLHEATGLPVIGVAKAEFHGGVARPVVRAGTRPLWVSTAGFDLDLACRAIQIMHGARLPDLLKAADSMARGR